MGLTTTKIARLWYIGVSLCVAALIVLGVWYSCWVERQGSSEVVVSSDRGRDFGNSGRERSEPQKRIDANSVVSNHNGETERSLEIQFPDGQRLTVSLVELKPAESPVPPKERLVDRYAQLVDSANAGNGASARELYYGLTNCRDALPNEKVLNAALERLKQTREAVSHSDGEVQSETIPEDVDLSPYEEDMKEKFHECQGITQEQIARSDYWLEIAVEAGDFLAMRRKALLLGINSRESFNISKSLWEAGHVSAATALAAYYSQGAHDGGDSPDNIRSYAYTLVSHLIYGKIQQDSMDKYAPVRLYAKEQVLSYKSGLLSPSEQAEAERLAAELVKQNANCCLGGWSSFDNG